MSEFKVEVVKIDNVIEHPNADKLTIVQIGGYNCIANKKDDGSWRYQKDEAVVYIPEGAIVPEWLLKRQGFWDESKGKGYLSGSQGNRVKAIKLRGVVSQGILYPVHQLGTIGSHLAIDIPNPDNTGEFYRCPVQINEDVSEKLQIVKYEPPIPVHMAGQITGGLFGYTKSYDIENAQKFPTAFEPGEYIVATEKLHGTLCQIGILNDAPDTIKHELFSLGIDHNYNAYVTSKGLAKKGIIQKNTDENEANLYVAAYKKFIEPKGEQIIDRFLKNAGLDPESSSRWRIYIFGEIFGRGVQDLSYGKMEPEFRIFDVYFKIMDEAGNVTSEGYLNALDLTNFCIAHQLRGVPNIFSGPFISLADLDQYRDGLTVEGDRQHIREGIVIKPHFEREFIGLPDNRLQLKYVSPDYLLRKDGTEYN